jgi:hypothetical protein
VATEAAWLHGNNLEKEEIKKKKEKKRKEKKRLTLTGLLMEGTDGVDCDGRGEYVGLVTEVFKTLVMVALVVALAAYALDCGAMTTPEQAMQCCSSMPCAPQGHVGQDCCKSMPSMHAPFVQPTSVHPTTHALAAVATLAASGANSAALAEFEAFSTSSHAPPPIGTSAFLPLRI